MALYHKHRPQQFSDVIGQEHVVKTITNQILTDSVAHAYLFSGPRGVGKTTTARLIAKAVNAPREKNSAEPDQSSQIAIDITQGRSIDVIEIDAASHTGVDHVREHIIDNAQFKPTSLPFKIFIIDEVHMLSTSAFNALLKTLEEPPAHAIFILATTELHKVPATIISRCQHFVFRRVQVDVIVAHLQSIIGAENREVDESVLIRIAQLSDGCVRDAVRLCDQLLSLSDGKITEEQATVLLPMSAQTHITSFTRSLFSRDTQSCLDMIHSVYAEGTDMTYFSDQLLNQFRDMLVFTLTNTTTGHNADIASLCTELSESATAPTLLQAIDLLLKRRSQIKSSPIHTLPIELFVLEFVIPQTETKSTDAPQYVTQTVPEIQKPVVKATKKEPVLKKVVTQPPEKSEQETKAESKEPIDDSPVSYGNAIVSEQDLRAVWPDFLKEMEQTSPSLMFILKTAILEKLTGAVALIHVPFAFHKTKLLSTEAKRHMEQTLGRLCKATIEIDVDIKAEETKKEDLSSVAAAFGGQVVG